MSSSRFGREKGYIQQKSRASLSHALRTEAHVEKRKRRNKDLEIVFDVDGHKDFVTGFRKRKQMRRKEAVKALEKLGREQKVEERAERRLAKREQYEQFLHPEEKNLESDVTEDQCDELEFEDESSRVQTVRITTIRTEEEEEDFKERLQRKKKAIAANEEKKINDAKKKMTKKGLSVLANTKLKLQGKSKFSGTFKKPKKDAGDGGSKSKKRKGQRRKGR